ncbi:hypothetical protein [Yoonia sp.]|uniref:hypothetical protein n=1 Tax=Yoonia sp. TaxID=2212373 RepID=UPI0025F6E31F|nr:hypothetical protein [Yoonia sp.]
MDDLDALQDRHAGCETVAFADLSTQMVLVTNSQTQLRRETLDMLCAEAAIVLGDAKMVMLGANPGNVAFVATKNQLRIFLRSESEPSDVLCCVCAPNLDVPGFLSDARPCLEKISHGA